MSQRSVGPNQLPAADERARDAATEWIRRQVRWESVLAGLRAGKPAGEPLDKAA